MVFLCSTLNPQRDGHEALDTCTVKCCRLGRGLCSGARPRGPLEPLVAWFVMTNERKLEERCTPGNGSETCPDGITAWALGTALKEQWQSDLGLKEGL